MPKLHKVEIIHFRQCLASTRCQNYGGTWPRELLRCPFCNEIGVDIGPSANVKLHTVRDAPEEDWTHGQGYEKASPDDIGL